MGELATAKQAKGRKPIKSLPADVGKRNLHSGVAVNDRVNEAAAKENSVWGRHGSFEKSLNTRELDELRGWQEVSPAEVFKGQFAQLGASSVWQSKKIRSQ